MFSNEKTTQAAAKFVKRAGGSIPYIVLLKLLYVADKEMLLTWGVPMTYDQWFSMRHGPVLSNTYNLIKTTLPESQEGTPPHQVQTEANTYWHTYLRKSLNNLSLAEDPGDDLLSEAEDHIIDQTFNELGSKQKWDLVDWTHGLPEWSDPGNSSAPITYEDVLRVNGLSAEAIKDAMNHIYTERDIASSLAKLEDHEQKSLSEEPHVGVVAPAMIG